MTDNRFHADDAKTEAFFEGLVSKHGVDPRSVDWGSRESQGRRFDVLTSIAPLSGSRILDVGCGTGDLYAWLQNRNVEVTYTGLDITPGMVDTARKRFPEATFHRASVLEWTPSETQPYDYVLASGIFYLRSVEPVAFLRQAVTRMYALARKGIAFNSLSTWASTTEADEFHADPLEVAAFCRTLSPRLTLRHDYHPRDFAILLHRPSS